MAAKTKYGAKNILPLIGVALALGVLGLIYFASQGSLDIRSKAAPKRTFCSWCGGDCVNIYDLKTDKKKCQQKQDLPGYACRESTATGSSCIKVRVPTPTRRPTQPHKLNY